MAVAAHPVLDHVGWTYIGIVIGWTTVLATAMGFLWYHRRLPQLQIRRLPLVFIAMTMLHMYWTLCMIGYVIGPVAPCAAEYWIMSILVPFGIATFQVANTQFLYIASQQRRFTSVQNLDDLVRGRKVSLLDGKTGSIWWRIRQRLSSIDQITRMVIFVGIGMTIQAILTILIFLLSRKFHPEFGVLPANLFGTDSEKRVQCSRGWEWWLSIAWQFFWAWIYAPYILWKSRNIKDTHGWRLQTILCCIAGLPCSPLWLCGLYLPQFAPINAVFIPPNWFSISIFLIESFTIFIPVYQVFRQHNLRTETLAAIADWEAKNKAFGSVNSDDTKVPSPTQLSFKTLIGSENGIVRIEEKATSTSSFKSRNSHMYTMIALEHALMWNAEPLQKFAALKDFSGENISFLTQLSAWKKEWEQHQQKERHNPFKSQSEKDSDSVSEDQLRENFNRAIRIYAAFISTELAEFPINISSRTQKQLDSIFAKPANLLFGDTASGFSNTSTINSSNAATPFADVDIEAAAAHPQGQMSNSSSDLINQKGAIWYWGDIPEAFSANIFNDAEKEIKYLVLTNTWPKFVSAGYAEQIQSQGQSLNKHLSQVFFGWRVNKP